MTNKRYLRTWKSSKSPAKQRKYQKNAPLHIKSKFVNAHLSKELKKKHNKRSLQLRTGDKVKILRGQFSGKTGKITKINIKKSKIYVEGMDIIKKDGNKSFCSIHPSNLMIIEMVMDDKRRLKSAQKNIKSSKTIKSRGKNNG